MPRLVFSSVPSFKALIATFFSIALSACGSDSEAPTPPPPVLDTTPPVITLNGDSLITLEHNMPYEEQGATATDNVDGTITVSTAGDIDTALLGDFTITYSATDSSGNQAVAYRTVKVIDVTAPIITLLGDAEIFVPFGEEYLDAGATAIDNADGELDVIVSGAVNVNSLGEYTLIYSASDSSGNTATSSRQVHVIDDESPVISLNGAQIMSLGVGRTYVEAGATALDNVDGLVEVTIIGTVDIDSMGDYVITYSAKDSSGNTASIERIVTIRERRPFVTIWNTRGSGISDSNQIKIDTLGDGYDYSINWGDGHSDHNVKGDITHTYATAGIYTVEITGDFPHFYLEAVGVYSSPKVFKSDNYKLLSVKQWGDIEWRSMHSSFRDADHARFEDPEAPDLSQVTDMSYMFKSQVDNEFEIADGKRDFTLYISGVEDWDVSNVTNMSRLFDGALGFNQDIGNWDVSNVEDMSYMFSWAINFDQYIGLWDVSKVTNMAGMLRMAILFNKDISGWNVSNVSDMSYMFSGEMFFEIYSIFNQDISAWDVANVKDMGHMFFSNDEFNQKLENWDVSNVENMDSMFWFAGKFNQSIADWDVSNVKNMDYMFSDAIAFNQNIGNWDVSNVTSMWSMFYYALSFNQDITGWNVSNVTNMRGMFTFSPFNQNIGVWDVSNVTNMENMFLAAKSFDQDLSLWDVSNVSNFGAFLDFTSLSVSNYDALLLSMSRQELQADVLFGGGANRYSQAAAAARQYLVDQYNWTITDGGLVEE